jgi:hypothetical protein
MADPLTLAAVLALAAQCAPAIDPNLIAGIAKHESGFVPDITHLNPATPTRPASVDYGMMQINDRNFAMLGLTAQTALDPCASIAAAQKLFQFISVYNTGSVSRGLAPCGPGAPPGCGYTVTTLASIQQVKAEQDRDTPELSGAPPAVNAGVPPAWDVFAASNGTPFVSSK